MKIEKTHSGLTANLLFREYLLQHFPSYLSGLKGKALDLTSAEYRLLCLLVKNANRVVTRAIILNELWDDAGNFVDDNTLSVYVRRLREKVESDPSRPEHLITVRGFGYQWKEVSV